MLDHRKKKRLAALRFDCLLKSWARFDGRETIERAGMNRD